MLGLIRGLILKIKDKDNREYFFNSQIEESIIRFQKLANQTLISSNNFAESLLEIKRIIF